MERKYCSFILGACLLLLAITGCGKVKKIELPVHTQADISNLRITDALEPIRFDTGVITMRRGTVIGSLYNDDRDNGDVCNYMSAGQLVWTASKVGVGNIDSELSDVFYQTLSQLGYNVVGDPSVVFKRQDEIGKATYSVAARVKNIKANICNHFDSWNGMPLNKATGEMFMDVEWTVFSNYNREVVFTCSTTGYGKASEGIPEGYQFIFQEAFASAAENFAAKTELVSILKKNNTKSIAQVKIGEALYIKKVPLFERPIKMNVHDVVDSAVTIRLPGGHGSGFFITNDGYILTNAHVVGGEKEVRIMLKGQVEVVGKVVKVDKLRDVALVKTELTNSPCLPIELTPVIPTEDVYAVGTPLDISMKATITKGVVSAIRYFQDIDRDTIQADVDIQHGNSGGPLVNDKGNIVGISVAIYSTKADTSIGISYFIPIKTALDVLNIEFK